MWKKEMRHSEERLICTPAGVRTLDPLIKSQMLYQLSYKRVRISLFLKCECKGMYFILNTKIFIAFLFFSCQKKVIPFVVKQFCPVFSHQTVRFCNKTS